MERITLLYANKDGHSYIRIAFRELHSEKQPPEDKTQIYIKSLEVTDNNILKFIFRIKFFLAQEKFFLAQVDFITLKHLVIQADSYKEILLKLLT